LGATKFYKRGEADEATSLEDTVEPWIEGFWNELPGLLETINKESA
jgi:hypothetical protein